MEHKKNLLFIYYRLFKPGGVTKTLVNLMNELVNDYNVTVLLLIKNENSYFELDPRVKVLSIDTFNHPAFTKGCTFLNTKLGQKIPRRVSIKSYLYDYGSYSTLKNWINKNHQQYDFIVTCLYKLSAYLSSNKQVQPKIVTWEKNSFEGINKFWQSFPRKHYKNIKGVVTLNNQGEKYYSEFNNNVKKIYNITGKPYEDNTIDFSTKSNQMTYVGRFSKEKNIDHIIDIFSKLKNKEDYILNLIGDGELRNKLEEQIQSLNLQDRIILHGLLKPTAVNEILKKSKFILLTSSTEGLPNVLVEGMMAGNDIVSYNCKYGPDEIINENNGFLIPLYDKNTFVDKLQYLIDNPKITNSLCISSYEEATKWKKEKIVKQWKDIFDN